MKQIQLSINGKLYPYLLKDAETRKHYLLLMNMFADKKLTTDGLKPDELAFIGWLALTFPPKSAGIDQSAFEDLFGSIFKSNKK